MQAADAIDSLQNAGTWKVRLFRSKTLICYPKWAVFEPGQHL